MHAGLPRLVRVHRLAVAGEGISGSVAVESLPRLSALLAESTGTIDVTIEFGRQQGRDAFELHLAGMLRLQCQRCLESFDAPLESRVTMLVVGDEAEARTVEEPAEPYISEDGEADLWQVVEDEAMLALPAVARHADLSLCTPLPHSAGAAVEEEERPNPFAVLKDWKGKGDSGD